MNFLLKVISKYAGYFHDGSIREIKHEKDSLVISIESAQVLQEWYWDRKQFPLSKRDTISGKFHLDQIKNIKENNELFNDPFKMVYDHCDLFDLEVEEYRIKMLITWVQYKPNRERTDMVSIEIEAEKIYWENIPTLFDDYWDSL